MKKFLVCIVPLLFSCAKQQIESISYRAEVVTANNTTNVLLVFIPNGFSPNGDGINDIFRPIVNNHSLVTGYNFSIYNGWGTVIFETTDLNTSWDGETKNKGVVDEVYTYSVSLEDISGGKHKLAGSVRIFK